MKHLRKSKKKQKAYVVIYSCSLTRAVFLELLLSRLGQKAQEIDRETMLQVSQKKERN